MQGTTNEFLHISYAFLVISCVSKDTHRRLWDTSIVLMVYSVKVLDTSETVMKDQQSGRVILVVNKWMLLHTTVTVLMFENTDNSSNIVDTLLSPRVSSTRVMML